VWRSWHIPNPERKNCWNPDAGTVIFCLKPISASGRQTRASLFLGARDARDWSSRPVWYRPLRVCAAWGRCRLPSSQFRHDDAAIKLWVVVCGFWQGASERGLKARGGLPTNGALKTSSARCSWAVLHGTWGEAVKRWTLGIAVSPPRDRIMMRTRMSGRTFR